MNRPGVLYGLGVGPGDPELLTLKAARVLSSVTAVFAAASSKNDHSIALSIAGPHLRPGVVPVLLSFPMTRDRAELEAAWERNGREVAEVLRSGRDAAFLTLGDPLLYSTFGYLLPVVRRLLPDAEVAAVPGVTSFQAAAAATLTVLAEDRETLCVAPGTAGVKRLGEVLDAADNTVILKAYRNFADIRGLIAERGRTGQALFVSRLGHADETVHRDLSAAPDKPDYLSLCLIGKKDRQDGGGD